MADMPIPEPSNSSSLRAVEAAIDALREGRAVTIGGDPALTVLAIETADAAALTRFAGHATPLLLLAPSRAATLLGTAMADGEAVAFHLPPHALTPANLRAIADPTAHALPVSPLEPAPLPAIAAPALALAKLARLLPALLALPAAADQDAVPVADIALHVAQSARQLERVSEAVVPLEGVPDCRLIAFRSPGSALEHLAIVVGDPAAVPAPLVRVHSECFTGDLLGSLRCDCGPQLRGAVQRIAAAGAGAVLYLAQEGRGIGLANKLRAYTLQDRGMDTLDANRALGFHADERDFAIAAAMLRDIGVTRVRLLTNNPDKLASLAAHGIEVVGRESLLFAANGVNDGYLQTKARRFGHLQD